jgi:hypothetical protein
MELVKAEGKGPVGRHKCRWKDVTQMDFKEVGCENVD